VKNTFGIPLYSKEYTFPVLLDRKGEDIKLVIINFQYIMKPSELENVTPKLKLLSIKCDFSVAEHQEHI
jgi:hypothetical protein